MDVWSRCAAMLVLLALSAGAQAADGDLDPSFNGSGVVSTQSQGGGNVQVLAQDDGQVVVVGLVSISSLLGVTRLHADGSTDTSFGSNGLATIAPPVGGVFDNVSASLDGEQRIVVGATVGYGDHSIIFVARLTNAGQLDSGFAGSGTLAINRYFLTSQGDRLNAISVHSDPVAYGANDTILLAGSRQDQYGSAYTKTAMVIPLHADGSYFTQVVGNGSFFFGGLSDIAHCWEFAEAGADYTEATAIARRRLQPSGAEIVAIGGNVLLIGNQPAFGFVQEIDASLNATGLGYSSFNFGSGTALVSAVAFDDSNRVLVGGAENGALRYDLGIARLATNGAYDNSFNGNGRKIIDFDESSSTYYSSAESLLVQHDGRILIGAQVQASTGTYQYQYALVRLAEGGSGDATFTSGTTIQGAHKYASASFDDYAYSTAFTQGEKVLLAGVFSQPVYSFGVLRLQGDRIFGDDAEAPVYLPRMP